MVELITEISDNQVTMVIKRDILTIDYNLIMNISDKPCNIWKSLCSVSFRHMCLTLKWCIVRWKGGSNQHSYTFSSLLLARKKFHYYRLNHFAWISHCSHGQGRICEVAYWFKYQTCWTGCLHVLGPKRHTTSLASPFSLDHFHVPSVSRINLLSVAHLFIHLPYFAQYHIPSSPLLIVICDRANFLRYC